MKLENTHWLGRGLNSVKQKAEFGITTNWRDEHGETATDRVWGLKGQWSRNNLKRVLLTTAKVQDYKTIKTHTCLSFKKHMYETKACLWCQAASNEGLMF